jgi:hypothetical protein
MTSAASTTTRIEADPKVPIIHLVRDFRATPEQLLRAHTDPDVFARWVGPSDRTITIDHWDARNGGRRSAAASTRSVPIASCRPSPGRACPRASRWRR